MEKGANGGRQEREGLGIAIPRKHIVPHGQTHPCPQTLHSAHPLVYCTAIRWVKIWAASSAWSGFEGCIGRDHNRWGAAGLGPVPWCDATYSDALLQFCRDIPQCSNCRSGRWCNQKCLRGHEGNSLSNLYPRIHNRRRGAARPVQLQCLIRSCIIEMQTGDCRGIA